MNCSEIKVSMTASANSCLFYVPYMNHSHLTVFHPIFLPLCGGSAHHPGGPTPILGTIVIGYADTAQLRTKLY